LVPASRFVPDGANDEKKKSLGRANAAKFVERLCKYPGDPKVIAEAQRHILEAHAERLTRETGKPVTVEDIEAGHAPRPKVLDMFAGGGSIPLEALRLGCEAYALDLNPVAHIIELCTLVYPQKYGKPDPTARGMTGPKNEHGETTWGGLAKEVRYWCEWVLKQVKAEIGDLYPFIPDQVFRGNRESVKDIFGIDEDVPPGYLVPVAYLWTRIVACKNPTCKASVPLVRQTWLCKKKDRYVALKMGVPKGAKCVRFEVVEAKTENGLGFDPAGFSKAGNATCPFCGTVADNDYVKAEGKAGRMGTQPMAVVCTRPDARGKVYLAADGLDEKLLPDDEAIRGRIAALSNRTVLTVPDEPMPKPGTLGFRVQPYGIKTWGELFTPRQMLSLLTFAAAVREAHQAMSDMDVERAKAVATLLGVVVDRVADWNSTLCSWSPENTGGAKIGHPFGRQALPMVWDFAESGLWGDATGSVEMTIYWVLQGIEHACVSTEPPIMNRGSATAQPWDDAFLDAVITDPPYYDNVPYADISDFFYVWLKRTIGQLYPEHFSGRGTPKKQEAVADASRHGGDKQKAVRVYESMMAQSLAEAHRVLKPGGTLAVVYAHKTTLGWSTLVDAFRHAGFTVTEAWPLDTEMKARMRAMDSAALATSIFLIGRKRAGKATGSYETDVQPELEAIVRERVETLWDQGISGADLVIACVGAGLRPSPASHGLSTPTAKKYRLSGS
jgi:putative DNA methylase